MTDSMVDWKLAAKLAGKIAPAGPKITPAEIRSAVESMRYAAHASVDHVYAITGLEAAADLRDSEVMVIDRASWAQANAQTFELMIEPLASSSMGKKHGQLNSLQKLILQKAGATEVGAALSFLSTRVLGQYDPYSALSDGGPKGGRLMIVAPNVLQAEKELNVESDDFRLWVCLHEQTHRVQFAVAPWLREYMRDAMDQLGDELGETSENVPTRIIDALKEARGAKVKPRGVDLLLSKDGRDTMDRVTAVMSLLEGHANVVMDAVDASIVPSVKTIRRRFNRRGETQGFIVKFISKLMNMDAKMKQYKDGQKFVQFIVDARGMSEFNRIWESAETLPTLAEIHDPQSWIDRVLGATEPQELEK